MKKVHIFISLYSFPSRDHIVAQAYGKICIRLVPVDRYETPLEKPGN